MSIICVGASHHSAPLEVRERICYTPHSLQATLARFGCGHAPDSALRELVIVSTCNRTELYAYAPPHATAELVDLLEETTLTPREEFAPFTFTHVDDAAVVHLCRVAAGLDSMVLGEPQILGQVADAFAAAMANGAAGPVLSRLFTTAMHAGKRVRAESAIGRNPTNIASVAVRLAERRIGELAEKHVLVVGAGDMAALTVAALHARHAARITVLGRTHAQVEELAAKWDARIATFEQLDDEIGMADIVISSTAAPHSIVALENVRLAMTGRETRPLVFIDLAVPRDIDLDVVSVAGVSRFDLDDLQVELSSGQSMRAAAVPAAEALIAEEVCSFVAWKHSLSVTPVLVDLRSRMHQIRQEEIEKVLRSLSHLSERDRRRVEAFARLLVNKVLHEPTVRLKERAAAGDGVEYAAAVRALFGLGEKP